MRFLTYTLGMCRDFETMSVKRGITLAWLALLLGSSCAWAATVYKTVDENGVVSFSDTAPVEEQAIEIIQIDARTPESSESAQEQLEAMRETTDRMVADRQQREKHRAELRQLQAEKTRQSQVIEYTAPTDYSYSRSGTFTGYYPYPVYRPGAGHRPKPRPPIARPPLRPRPPTHRPEHRVISPGHDYPASLIRKSYSAPVRAAFEK